MKRFFIAVLVLMLVFSFSACGDEVNNSSVEQSTPQNDNIDLSDNLKEVTEPEDEISFTEQIAVDNESCSIKITSIEADNIWGYTLKAQLDNKSTDKTYMFSAEDCSINGVQCDPFFATEVAAGKKSNVEISFPVDTLEKNGINKFSDIKLSFRVYDSNDWIADPVAHETIHIYPYGEEKAERYVRESQANDNIIVDNEYVTVVVTGYSDDPVWGYSANLFLVNKTDSNIMISANEASVNGFMADPFYATSVPADTCAFSAISWSDSILEENGISEVETIEFKLRAYNEENWMGEDFVNEIITLNP